MQPITLPSVRTDQEDAITPDHRRADASSVLRDFPAHVLGRAPAHRQVLLGAGPIACRPPPPRPVVRPRPGNWQHTARDQGQPEKDTTAMAHVVSLCCRREDAGRVGNLFYPYEMLSAIPVGQVTFEELVDHAADAD